MSRDLLTSEEHLELYRAMVLHRAAEERLETLQKQGLIGGSVYRGLGQEAGAVGAAWPLRRRDDGTGDVLAPTVREVGALFLFGGTPLELFRQYLARGTGPTRGKEANVHWCDFRRGLLGPVSPLGTMVEVMAGVTLAFRMRGEDRVGIVYAGDGASSTGAWHEGLNFAAVRRCPLLLIIEANQWAFSTPTSRQTRVASFVEKAPGYGIEAESVDGTDVLEVLGVTSRAAERARSGGGTQMIELRYYRMKGHAQHDNQEYVDPAELAAWEARDPIGRFGARLVAEGHASPDELDASRRAIEAELAAAAERAVADPLPSPEEALERVYADVSTPPPWTRASDRETALTGRRRHQEATT